MTIVKTPCQCNYTFFLGESLMGISAPQGQRRGYVRPLPTKTPRSCTRCSNKRDPGSGKEKEATFSLLPVNATIPKTLPRHPRTYVEFNVYALGRYASDPSNVTSLINVFLDAVAVDFLVNSHNCTKLMTIDEIIQIFRLNSGE